MVYRLNRWMMMARTTRVSLCSTAAQDKSVAHTVVVQTRGCCPAPWLVGFFLGNPPRGGLQVERGSFRARGDWCGRQRVL